MYFANPITLDKPGQVCYTVYRNTEEDRAMYQIVNSKGERQSWLVIRGGQLVEVSTFANYSEAWDMREHMEQVRGERYEIHEVK